ncbi:MAG TPA: AraC family transcriptional regulator, partial [Clostridiales bacterium]|nr:AraC family transcriptional regulator [Clostridiales bacterium]
EERYNFTEVSEMLGFSTIHYFSNVFKKTTGMTPSEYICSVKSKV